MKTKESPTSPRQRSDLTFKHNISAGRHGWFRLTPAYSVKLVQQIISALPSEKSVIDPFSGTGTTALAAAQGGMTALGLDINPFLAWLGRVKIATYPESAIDNTLQVAKKILSSKSNNEAMAPPPISNVERWWDKPTLNELCFLKGAIDSRTDPGSGERDLLTLAFLRVMIDVSNASFNHQSMSFKVNPTESNVQLNWLAPQSARESFFYFVEDILESAIHSIPSVATIAQSDARQMKTGTLSEFDFLITSPPYVNRMSYIRELRPYMYWTGFLRDSRQAAEIDWEAIGGTWGIATSRLAQWQPVRDLPTQSVQKVCQAIRSTGETSCKLLGNYVEKYFHDMGQHFAAVPRVLRKGGQVHYIIGNSKFYGVLVPAEQIYAELLEAAGFHEIEIETIRKRNSKKELFEYHVSGRWLGKSS